MTAKVRTAEASHSAFHSGGHVEGFVARGLKFAIPAHMQEDALVDIKVVRALCGFTSSTPIYDRLREGAFVEPIRLSSRCTRWRLRDVRRWLAAQGHQADESVAA
jgi:prophage regulatory protein